MGLFGGESDSTSNQSTTVQASNQQGISAPTSGRNNVVAEDSALFAHRSNMGYAQDDAISAVRSRVTQSKNGGNAAGNNLTIYNGNSTELAQIAADISTSALDYYDQQNKRSLKLAEEVARATTSSNKDIINEFAAITEKQNQSEALTLNEQLLKYGVVALIGFFIFQGAKRA